MAETRASGNRFSLSVESTAVHRALHVAIRAANPAFKRIIAAPMAWWLDELPRSSARIASVQLLGAQVVLTGVRPEVATILVGLAIDWGNIVMRGTLQSGIAYATSLEQRRASPPAV